MISKYLRILFLVGLGWCISSASSEPAVDEARSFHSQVFTLRRKVISAEEQMQLLHKSTNAIPLRKGSKITPPNRTYQLLVAVPPSVVPEKVVWERRFVTSTDSPSSAEVEHILLTSTYGVFPSYPPRFLDVLLDINMNGCVVVYQRESAIWADVVTLTNGAAINRLPIQFLANRLVDQRYLEPPSPVTSAEITKAKELGTYAVLLKFSSGFSTNFVFDGIKWQPGAVKP